MSHQSGILLQDSEAVPVVVDQSVRFHFDQLSCHGAAVNAKVLCQLHSAKGNLNVAGVLGLCLDGKVCQQLFPDGALGYHFNLAHQIPVLVGDDTHHIFNEPVVEHTGHGAAVHHPVKGHEENPGILGNQEGHNG